MNRNPKKSGNSQEQGSEKVAQEGPVINEPDGEKPRKNGETPEKQGEKDGAVLGKIND